MAMRELLQLTRLPLLAVQHSTISLPLAGSAAAFLGGQRQLTNHSGRLTNPWEEVRSAGAWHAPDCLLLRRQQQRRMGVGGVGGLPAQAPPRRHLLQHHKPFTGRQHAYPRLTGRVVAAAAAGAACGKGQPREAS